MIKDRKEMLTKRKEIDLNGPEGNAFCLMGYAKSYARQLDINGDKIVAEMMAGDYDELVDVFDKYFGEYVTLYR